MLITFCGKRNNFFHNFQMNRKFKRTAFIWPKSLCNCNTPPTRVRTVPNRAGALTRNAKGYIQPLASVARAPLFEVRGVRFTHSPYWHTSVTLTPPKPHSRPGHSTNVTPLDTGPHRPNSVSFRAGLEPGIPAREAGALTRNAKGYSL